MNQQTYSHILLHATTAGSILSFALHAFTPWRRTVMSRHLFWYLLALAITFALASVDLELRPDPAWFEMAQVVEFTALPVVIFWRVVLQVYLRWAVVDTRPRRSPAEPAP